MIALSVEVWLALVLACHGKEFMVSDEDQGNVAYVCELAAKSPTVNIETTAGIAQFCIRWKKKMQDATKPPDAPQSDDKAEPRKDP